MKKLKVLLLLLVGAILFGAAAPVAAQELELWTFVNTHARWFREQAERYAEEVNANFALEVIEIAYGDMHDRLQISIQSGGVGAPDIADVEQGRFGGFLRGGDPGFVELNALLDEGGHTENLVSARQALYTSMGSVYGIEHALTPVVLYYRADVWEGAGFDPQAFATWDDFVEAGRAIVAENPAVIPLHIHGGLHELLLRQQGHDYFNEAGEVNNRFGRVDCADGLAARFERRRRGGRPADGRRALGGFQGWHADLDGSAPTGTPVSSRTTRRSFRANGKRRRCPLLKKADAARASGVARAPRWLPPATTSKRR